MTYELEFDPRALKEWQKLGETVKKSSARNLSTCCQIRGLSLRGCVNCQIATKSS